VNTTVQPEAPTASPAPREQSLSTFLHVETMNDLDDGRPTLVAGTESNLGDLCETSPARARGLVADARARLDQAERLINEYEAATTLAAILAEHDLTLVEVDLRTVAEFAGDLAPRLACWAGKENGRVIVWVPAGQDPVKRTNAVADLVNDPASVVHEVQA